jgi:FkbM family methyltransferase
MSYFWSALIPNSLFQKLASASRASVTLALKESFIEICKILEIRTLIEAGAHEASTSIEFMQLGNPHSVAIAIEPNPYTYWQKTVKAEMFGVKTLNVGVGQLHCEKELNIPINLFAQDKSPLNASFLEKRNHLTEVEKVLVNIQTLDAIFRDEKLIPPLALWIDVEGFSGDVLKGAVELFNANSIRLIYVELEDKELWIRQTLDKEVCSTLKKYGFELLIRDFEGRGQYNAIFCKTKDFPIVCHVKHRYLRMTTVRIIKDFQKFPIFVASWLIRNQRQGRRGNNF